MSLIRPIAVIFDLDGTLIDSLPGIEFSVKAAFAKCGIPYPPVDLRAMIGPPIRNILSQVTKTGAPGILDDLENAFRTSYDRDGWRRTVSYPSTEAALSSLREAAIRLFVVTNKPQHISLRTMEMLQIGQSFERIVTRDSRTPQYADKREMIESILHSCALGSDECLLVGDTEEDADAAAECAMRFVHVGHGYGIMSDRRKSLVHLRLNDLSQLSQKIGLELAHDR